MKSKSLITAMAAALLSRPFTESIGKELVKLQNTKFHARRKGKGNNTKAIKSNYQLPYSNTAGKNQNEFNRDRENNRRLRQITRALG